MSTSRRSLLVPRHFTHQDFGGIVAAPTASLPEELDHLPGYADSRPVRIGNGAVDQRQTDVLGEVMVALELARHRGLAESPDTAALQAALADDLATHWDEPDHGIWEIRAALQHFTHSGDGVGGDGPGHPRRRERGAAGRLDRDLASRPGRSPGRRGRLRV